MLQNSMKQKKGLKLELIMVYSAEHWPEQVMRAQDNLQPVVAQLLLLENGELNLRVSMEALVAWQ